MQGASRVFMVVMLGAGAVPAAASAQVLDVPPVQVPSVSLPSVTLPAPLPQVSTPPVSTPPVTVPEVRVDAPLPSPPQVKTPAAPETAGAVPHTPTASSGQAPSGTVAAAGTPSASPARGGRVARAAAVHGGRGVLGTGYRSRRRLVRALSACVAGLPGRQARLVVMRYGVGAAATHPDRAVAGALGLSRGEYATVRSRALRGMVRDARDGGCRDGAAASAIASAEGGELRPASATVGVAMASAGAIVVRGERASGTSAPEDPDRGGPFTTPLAVDVGSNGSHAGALLMLAGLGLLALVGLRALRAAVRR
jgi:hypothetical protein